MKLRHVLYNILCCCCSPTTLRLWVGGRSGGVSGKIGMVAMLVVGVVIGGGGGGAEGSEDPCVGKVRCGGICRGSAERGSWA